MSPDFYKALEISGIGIAGVFIFMTLFYFVIIGLDKAFPNEKKPKKAPQAVDENSGDE